MKSLVVLLTALWVPFQAVATDGDAITGADVSKGSFSSSSFVLCDGVLEADSSCDEFDLNIAGRGMPDFLIISRDAVDSDCSGNVTITINGQTTAGGTEHAITFLNDTNTSRYIAGPRNRFIDADLTNQTGCDDGGTDTGVTVNMTLFFRTK